jgi:hypothetical protein
MLTINRRPAFSVDRAAMRKHAGSSIDRATRMLTHGGSEENLL